MRVALDLMGGDDAPGAVLDGALRALDDDRELHLLLVGPGDAVTLDHERVEVVPAAEVVAMDEDPVRAVRAKRDASVRIAARLVRDGRADAMVSAGSTGAVLAAALFTFGRLPGVTRPPLAVVVPAAAGPLVLLDVGANPDCGPDLLAQFALAGSAYATVRLGIAEPWVGLLTIGAEVGKGDELRRAAYDVLAALPVAFAGPVEGQDVPLGGRADVVVTDGFTGNVLLKGLEGALAGSVDVDGQGGAILLGVDGVTVVAHGGASARAIASAIGQAADAARAGLVARIAGALGALVAQHRAQAGLGGVAGLEAAP